VQTQDFTARTVIFQVNQRGRGENAFTPSRAKLAAYTFVEVKTVPEKKPEESFRVIDRRPFTTDGELREEFVAEQQREAQQEGKKAAEAPQTPAPVSEAKTPPAETPKPLAAFENLIRMIGSNGAMVLGAYTDPRTGQPVIDPEAARELIDMLDALHEKTKGNLAPEEDSLLLDLLGKLKMTYVEVNQALAAQAAQAASKAKGR
jgi:Domain of unknown function (DUF1844)